MKSDRFQPTIGLKLEANTATLRATVNQDKLSEVKILIRLMSRNILGQKCCLGKIEIDSKSSLWREIVKHSSTPLTNWIHFD